MLPGKKTPLDDDGWREGDTRDGGDQWKPDHDGDWERSEPVSPEPDHDRERPDDRPPDE